MIKSIKIWSLVFLTWSANIWAQDSQEKEFLNFQVASVHFEQNATDGDVEVVFEIKAGDEGLSDLKVVSSDGRTVIDFSAPEKSTLGIRQFRFESPEPGDVEGLKSAYPEGQYIFNGTTMDGVKFTGNSNLNHKLPETAEFIYPEADAEDVPFEALEIVWNKIDNIISYMLEIEQDDFNIKLEAKLPAVVCTFNIPNNLLFPGKEYSLSIGTLSMEGNISYVETSFTTASNKD